MISLTNSDPSLFDPYFSSTVLLLGFENTLNDVSPANSVVSTGTVSGPWSYSGSTVKFDSASAYLGPTTVSDGPYLSIANTSSFYFALGDFTIETWINVNGLDVWQTTNTVVMDITQKTNGVNGGPSGFYLTTSSAGGVSAFKVAVYDNTAMGFTASNTVLGVNQWNHIVTGRTGGTFYIGTNGVLQNVGFSLKRWFPYSVAIKEDAYNEGRYGAYFDEFRVTKGVWRYGTGTTYTTPTTKFPRQ
jgi:hypothetical protein